MIDLIWKHQQKAYELIKKAVTSSVSDNQASREELEDKITKRNTPNLDD